MTHIPENFPAYNAGKTVNASWLNFDLSDFCPFWQNGAVQTKPPSPWDFDAIVARANARARELYKVGAVRYFETQGAEDLLNVRKPPTKQGVGLLRLEKMARLLKWTLPQLLGIEGDRALDKAKLKMASRIVVEVCGSNIPTPGEELTDFISDWLDIAYEIVHSVSIDRPDSWDSEDSFLAMAAAFRASFLRSSTNAKPAS